MNNKYAILIDGGYFTKVFHPAYKRYPTAQDVASVMRNLQEVPELAGKELLRIFYYDAPPAQIKMTNPLNLQQIDLGNTPLARNARKLHSELEKTPDFALRMGELKTHSWSIKPSVLKKCEKRQKESTLESPAPESTVIYPDDLKPEIEQKGVDLKIGMDIASMAIRQMVDCIVMITGDSDLVPALKLARREGLRVYCVHFSNRKLTDVLAIHSDRIITLDIGNNDES